MAKIYVSEHTQFMDVWLAKNPEQRLEKFKGRKLWWDKDAKTPDDLHRIQASKVPQKAYVYDVN